MNPVGKHFANRTAREKAIADQITERVRNSEEETMPSRRQWQINSELFAGRMNWGQDDEGAQWQSRIFLHEFAPIIREATMATCETLLQSPHFVSMYAFEGGDKELARIREKIIRYYMNSRDDMAFPTRFFEFVMSGCCFGMATFKHTVRQISKWKPEVVIERVQRAMREQMQRSMVDAEPAPLMPNGIDELEAGLEDAVQMVLGGPAVGIAKRGIASKKQLDLAIKLKVINPHNFFWHADSDDINESPWKADIMYPKFFELIPYFESGTLDKRKKDRMLNSSGRVYSGSRIGMYGSREYQKYRQKEQYANVNATEPECELIDYFGPIMTKDGSEFVEEMAHVIIGNGRQVLLDAPVGYWAQKPPYQTSLFNRRPHKPDGAGVADGAVGQQILLNQLFSLFVDLLKLDTYAPTAIQIDKLAEPSQIEEGIRPGEMIRLYGEGKAQDAIGNFATRSVQIAPTLIQTLETLKLSTQKSASVSTMSSNPASRARISSAEVTDNVGQRNLTINSLGTELDYSCLIPIVEMTDEYILQFGFEDENLERLVTKGVVTEAEFELLSRIPREERFIEANKHYKVEVRGFRAAMEREKELRSTSELLQQLPQFPPQVVATKINWSELLTQTFERFGFDVDSLINQNTPFDKATEENNLLRLGQMVSIFEQDEDAVHLPVHYQEVLQSGPNQGLMAHVMGHINRMMMQGQQPPPPPPEIAQLFGMGEETPAQKSGAGAARKIEADQKAPRLIQ